MAGIRRVRASGFGDVQTRLKINLWGNDGGDDGARRHAVREVAAAGVRSAQRPVEGGVIVPFGVDLPRGWGLGLMTEFDWVRDRAEASDYDTDS